MSFDNSRPERRAITEDQAEEIIGRLEFLYEKMEKSCRKELTYDGREILAGDNRTPFFIAGRTWEIESLREEPQTVDGYCVGHFYIEPATRHHPEDIAQRVRKNKISSLVRACQELYLLEDRLQAESAMRRYTEKQMPSNSQAYLNRKH